MNNSVATETTISLEMQTSANVPAHLCNTKALSSFFIIIIIVVVAAAAVVAQSFAYVPRAVVETQNQKGALASANRKVAGSELFIAHFRRAQNWRIRFHARTLFKLAAALFIDLARILKLSSIRLSSLRNE